MTRAIHLHDGSDLILDEDIPTFFIDQHFVTHPGRSLTGLVCLHQRVVEVRLNHCITPFADGTRVHIFATIGHYEEVFRRRKTVREGYQPELTKATWDSFRPQLKTEEYIKIFEMIEQDYPRFLHHDTPAAVFIPVAGSTHFKIIRSRR